MKTSLCTAVIVSATVTIAASVQGALVEKAVEYEHVGVTLEGFHVYDDSVPGRRPAVLVIHQWTGLSDYEKRRSRELAGMGYNVFAADIYGKGVSPQPPEAGKEAGKRRIAAPGRQCGCFSMKSSAAEITRAQPNNSRHSRQDPPMQPRALQCSRP